MKNVLIAFCTSVYLAAIESLLANVIFATCRFQFSAGLGGIPSALDIDFVMLCNASLLIFLVRLISGFIPANCVLWIMLYSTQNKFRLHTVALANSAVLLLMCAGTGQYSILNDLLDLGGEIVNIPRAFLLASIISPYVMWYLGVRPSIFILIVKPHESDAEA